MIGLVVKKLLTKQLMRKSESKGRSEEKGGLTRNVQRSLIREQSI
jgi:hypothetical protein